MGKQHGLDKHQTKTVKAPFSCRGTACTHQLPKILQLELRKSTGKGLVGGSNSSSFHQRQRQIVPVATAEITDSTGVWNKLISAQITWRRTASERRQQLSEALPIFAAFSSRNIKANKNVSTAQQLRGWIKKINWRYNKLHLTKNFHTQSSNTL